MPMTSMDYLASPWLLLTVTMALADAPRYADPKSKVPNKIPIKAYAFDLREVRVLDGPFKHAQDLDQKYLLSLDVNRLLHTFRLNAGLTSEAKPLGGWEEPKGELRGHFAGHYLSGCALMYASTGDERLKEKGDQLVAGLAECQAKMGSGYLSAYPEEFFDRVEAQKRVWAPYYTLHKIYAGLLDMYVYCDNQQALEVAKKFCDWVIARNARLTDEQMQRMLGNEHGGMNEVLANIYAVTGDEKYLKIAQRFNHLAVISPAAKTEDKLTGLHANTQIPKFVGAARQYELTGEDWLKTASIFFWDTVVKERSYVIGGHSDGEMFSPKERLSQAFGPNTTETCNTYNMLKLTRHLFCWEPKAEYADYYERALINHILCSQHPETGMMCYYVPLKSGSKKNYNDPLNSFWCCTGTGVENHGKYGDSIYFHDGANKLYVNLFIASELNWKSKGIKVRQETGFPEQTTTRLILTCAKPAEAALHLRHPFWATTGFEVKLNGKRQSLKSQPGSYAVIDRRWKSGDTVEVAMPFTLRTEGFRDNPNRFAFLNGPLVLCAGLASAEQIPVLAAASSQALAAITPLGAPSTFAAPTKFLRIVGEPNAPELQLGPLYKMHDRHYQVYWDALTPAEFQAKEAEYQAREARRKELTSRSIDLVTPNVAQNERAHQQRGERTGAGDFNGRHYRHATDGGWFSYEMKVLPDVPVELLCTFWGSDSGSRTFDILVDNTKLATQRLQNNKPGQFYDATYPLPEELTKGKNSITVKFQAHPGNFAGGVFECRTLKKK